jgi:hypothetical protein
LFYVELGGIYVILALSMDFVKSFMWIYDEFFNLDKIHYHAIGKAILTIITYLFMTMLVLAVHYFFSFHRKLVYENKTTIENLEHKDKPTYSSRYDIDKKHNTEQIMGTNRWIWLLPIMPQSSFPHGDGINFKKNFDSDDESEGEAEGDNNSGNNDNQESRNMNYQPEENKLVNESANGTKQGDRMTIHNGNSNKWDNLNNIVRAEVNTELYKSNKDDENKQPVESKAPNQKYTNDINAQNYEQLK